MTVYVTMRLTPGHKPRSVRVHHSLDSAQRARAEWLHECTNDQERGGRRLAEIGADFLIIEVPFTS